jgi:hypothetical protein
MTSAKQVEANKKNAQHSSGPTSAAGRQKAALNSVTHGLTAQTIILPEHEKEAYQFFSDGILTDLAPASVLEGSLATSIIDARWRIHQIASMEAALYAVGFRNHAHEFENEPLEQVAAMCRLITFEEKRKELDRLHRYESRLIRQAAKDMQLLAQSQAARKAQEEKDNAPTLVFESAEDSAEIGFVLQNAKIDAQPAASPTGIDNDD